MRSNQTCAGGNGGIVPVPLSPPARPRFRFEVVGLAGPDGDELDAEQARAIREALGWLRTQQPRRG